MKKSFLTLSLLLISFMSFSFANESLDQAISWMNNNGLTKFNNEKDFMANKSLRRDEATKFFVQYATEVLGLTPDISKTDCDFYDLNNARPDLKDMIKKSCQLGLFKGNNGKFMPTQSLTNAQAITVLIRMIDGYKDETEGHFANKYFDTATKLKIMNGLELNSKSNFDKLTTRGEVARLLYNSSNINFSNNTNINTTNPIIETNNSSSIYLNTPFTIEGIEYQILGIKLLDKIGSSTNQYIGYKYPTNNNKWLMIEYSFKNIDAKYGYAGTFKLQNGEYRSDSSVTALVYADEQMGYEPYTSNLLKGAKQTTYIGYDIDYEKIKDGKLIVSPRTSISDNSLEIPLKNLLK